MKRRSLQHFTAGLFDAAWAVTPEWHRDAALLIADARAGGRVGRATIKAKIVSASKPVTPQGGGVAVLNIFGVLRHRTDFWAELFGALSMERVGQAFDQAVADGNVQAIVLNIDSPGGTVAGTKELADKIFAARGSKRIIAVANSMAASAAYWIASAADEIAVTPSGMVGSIGVIYPHFDDTGWEAKQGFKTTYFTGGKFKAEDRKPLTEQTSANYQSKADAIYAEFVNAVARNRKVSPEAVRKGYGEGSLLTAAQAMAEGMVDRVESLESVLLSLGVGSGAAVSPQASGPAFRFPEGFVMNPELFGLLVAVGMCQITAQVAEAEAALARFMAARRVPMPADDAGKIAALKAYVSERDAPKPATAPIAAPVQAAPVTPAVSTDRHDTIMAAVKCSSLPADKRFEVAQALIAAKDASGNPLSVEAAIRKLETDYIGAQQQSVGATIVPGPAEKDKLYDEGRAALMERMWGGSMPKQVFDYRTKTYADVKAAAPNYGLQNMLRLAETCLASEGIGHHQLRRLSPMQIAQLALGANPRHIGVSADVGAYNTTGMFSSLMLDAANMTLRKSYDEVMTTFQVWMRRGESVPDFKDVHRVVFDGGSDPQAIPENGEFAEIPLSDGKESYKLVMWGGRCSLSYQAIVNDSLSAFTRVPALLGAGMRRKQNRLAYSVVKDNATMADTGALFNTTAVTTAGGHANKTTGSATPTVATLNSMTTKMMVQKGLNTDADGSAVLNLKPTFLPHPPALMGTVLELLGSTANPAASGNSGIKNIWQNALTPITEAELSLAAGGSDTAWYLAADSNQVDTVEYAYLQGLETPVIEQEAFFTTLGIAYRIYQAFGVKAIDWRGMQMHAGA